MQPKPGGKKLPKWFWVVGLGAAILIGLYLRNRSSSSGSSQQATSSQSAGTGGATDVTSNPYFYTNSGAYPDPYGYGSSPYGMGSLSGGYGLPSGFDPTSFEEGITYQQSQGSQLTTLPNWLSPDQSTALGANLQAPVATPANGGTPAQVTINITPHTTGRKPGQANTSGRRVNNGRHTHPAHKPKDKKVKHHA